ncbi:hypothetical protein Ddye_021336 [Dipteronia dyeriana]|uniref:Uncharacterized protein n=1 Tax=Dipteronia dyeriana TaxID=168575 RepID=A0AAD9WWT1_9ROSI|nr:hypothetical protein Ddye_021336 [Dipteronia dyeriana]
MFVPDEEPKKKESREIHRLLQVAGSCPASLRPGHWLDLYSKTGYVGLAEDVLRCIY